MKVRTYDCIDDFDSAFTAGSLLLLLAREAEPSISGALDILGACYSALDSQDR